MNEDYFIPANYTDAGKVLGAFPLRNAVEAVCAGLPLFLLVMYIPAFSFTVRLVAALTAAVPASGFALLGVQDDSLSQFLLRWLRWKRRRRILFYRGTEKGASLWI